MFLDSNLKFFNCLFPILAVALSVHTSSCVTTNRHEASSADLSAIRKWHPVEQDGESIDAISELWNYITHSNINNFSLHPSTSLNLEKLFLIYSNRKLQSLKTLDGQKYEVDTSMGVEITNWIDSDGFIEKDITAAFITCKHKTENDESHDLIVAIALEGGPFFILR